jgi:predicted RNA binding protein YcfA (HicA-like mRNA interferase family)
MKVREIIQIIEKDGWYRIPAKGGHLQYKHSIKRGKVTVAGQMSDELAKKMEKSILRQAGLA